MNYKSISTFKGEYHFNTLPDQCPFCHKKISANVIYGFSPNDVKLDLFLNCPNSTCNKTFIGFYELPFKGIFNLEKLV